MQPSEIKPNVILRGSLFQEPLKVITTIPMGESLKTLWEGMESGKVHQPILKEDQLAQLKVSSEEKTFDGDPLIIRLGIETCRGI